ncbi:RNA-directed DNA polymerase, eukaryota, reverse transcriptase zinc-binding domain protein [Tanacetum coccineum]
MSIMNTDLRMVAWNLKDMCNKEMQKEVKKFICDEKLSICFVLENHIKEKGIKKICDFVYGNWNSCSNLKDCNRGCRVIVWWNEDDVSLMQIHSKNSGNEMRHLWKELGRYKSIINDKPWVLMGDWNVSLHIEDHSEGESCKTSDMMEFQECIEHTEVEDLNFLGNVKFMGTFTNSHALFLPHLTFDHSPAILIIPKMMKKKYKAFRFSNFIADKSEFVSVVQDEWNNQVEGCYMFKLVKKLKALKFHMKRLRWMFGNLHEKVIEWKEKLQVIQKKVDKDPHIANLKEQEAMILNL